MDFFKRIYQSSIGMKWCMAVTGLALFGFLVAHMVGNLKLFLGQDAINDYAVWLKHLPLFGIWFMRAGLLAVFVLHVATAIRLTRLNRVARPVGYVRSAPNASTYASRTMMFSGIIVLAYAIYHLMHLTFGKTHPDHYAMVDAAGRHDVYSMVVLGFQQPMVAAIYLAANAILAFHLSHGIASMLQTMGINHPKWTPCINKVGPVVAFALFVGYASIPIAVQLDFITLPTGG